VPPPRERERHRASLALRKPSSGSLRRQLPSSLRPRDLRLTDVVLEALFSFWIDFQKKAGEGGEDSSANSLGPYQRLRENILDKFDANTRTQRELLEAHLDMDAFIRFLRRLEDLKN
jgi:hypothetical protein